MNFIGGGRNGLFTAFFGLFAYLVAFCACLLFYTFAAAVGIVYCMLMGIRWLYRRHKAKKASPFLSPGGHVNLPTVIVSRVSNPRDWTPPR